MLQLNDISLKVSDKEEAPFLLRNVSLTYPKGHFGAVVGPSGCGKSTLLKTIVGLFEPQDGEVCWEGRNLEDQDLHPTELGYVPQFSIFYENLSVRECVTNSVKLRVHRASRELSVKDHVDKILSDVGLTEIADRRAKVLSGGQRRRLGLALELVTHPDLLLCDEVTSGLDPKSEDEIVQLMRYLADQESRIVLSVTHSIRHLDLYDSITVLYAGYVVYQGHPSNILSYFNVTNAEDIYPALYAAEASVWAEHWIENKENFQIVGPEMPESKVSEENADEEQSEEAPPKNKKKLPGFFNQMMVLFFRRWKLFFRDASQVTLQAALVVIFPVLVVIFALDGLPDIKNMSMDINTDVLSRLKEQLAFTLQSFKVGSLVSNLAFLQVVLLTLMGSNNSAREVASERAIWEKEKLAGVSVLSYLSSKTIYLLLLVLIQAGWMALFVKQICDLPGDFTQQAFLLLLATLAMTTTCLAISAWARTAEQGSLIAIYLVGFQVPLSGAILDMPAYLEFISKPFITAYWAWAGYLQTMQETRFYDLVVQIAPTTLSSLQVTQWVLLCQILVSLLIAFFGCARGQWAD